MKEYFLYDPTSDYLDPPLQGYRLERGDHTKIEPDDDGALRCEQLDITLRLDQGRLVMHDSDSGEVLHTEAEAEKAAREAAEMAGEAERA